MDALWQAAKNVTMGVIDWNAVSAVATAAATCVALWLGLSQSRYQTKYERIRAHIVAASLAPRLEFLTLELRNFQAGLSFTDVHTGVHGTPFEEACTFLALQNIVVSMEELTALAALGNNCSFKLSNAISLLNVARTRISEHVKECRNSASPLTEDAANDWLVLIDKALGRFEIVERQCRNAAKIPAAAPSGQELYGD